jgi:hypothetical protein
MIAERRNRVDMDLDGLSEEDIAFIRRIVEILRVKPQRGKTEEKDTDDETPYETGPLGVKGTLSRREIYDRL